MFYNKLQAKVSNCRQLSNRQFAVGYSYGYDQLNQILHERQHTSGSSATGWDNDDIINDYKEDISYDANGNIKAFGYPSVLWSGSTARENKMGEDFQFKIFLEVHVLLQPQ